MQKAVLEILGAKIAEHPSAMCIMGGDFNANTKGGRSGYAESNRMQIEKIDKLFQDFIQQTDSLLLAPEALSRKDDAVEKTAKVGPCCGVELISHEE